jgi:hypothetical protein
MFTPHLLVHHIVFIKAKLYHGLFFVGQRYSIETNRQVKKILKNRNENKNENGNGNGNLEIGNWKLEVGVWNCEFRIPNCEFRISLD